MVQVAIWGSCVSRDMCELWGEAKVVTYVARQSAVSYAHSKPDAVIDVNRLESNFQAKSLAGDIGGDAVVRLTQADPEIVLLDIVDERRGIWEFPNGGFLTNSIEAYNLDIDNEGPRQGAKLIEFGTERHFILWKESAEKAIAALRADLPGVPIIALDVAWAERSADKPTATDAGRAHLGLRGEAKKAMWKLREGLKRGQGLKAVAREVLTVPESQAETQLEHVRYMNQVSRRYLDTLTELVNGVAVLPQSTALSTAEHKWGEAPYHYIDDNYRHLIAQVKEICRELETGEETDN